MRSPVEQHLIDADYAAKPTQAEPNVPVIAGRGCWIEGPRRVERRSPNQGLTWRVDAIAVCEHAECGRCARRPPHQALPPNPLSISAPALELARRNGASAAINNAGQPACCDGFRLRFQGIRQRLQGMLLPKIIVV